MKGIVIRFVIDALGTILRKLIKTKKSDDKKIPSRLQHYENRPEY